MVTTNIAAIAIARCGRGRFRPHEPVQPSNSGGPSGDDGGNVTGDPALTRNDGWAIKSEVAAGFLRRGAVAVAVAESGSLASASVRDVARHVTAYAVPLICYR